MTTRGPGRTCDDGRSRPFVGRTSRDVIAEALARRDGWAEIRPGQWALAGRIVRDLRAAGWPTRQHDRQSTEPARHDHHTPEPTP